MKVWIDLANSPHVCVFGPIRERLLARGHKVHLTARAFSHTVPLARARGWSFTTIGDHGGAGLLGKAHNLMNRSLALRRWAATARPDVAVGHNSYSQSVAARMLGIVAATIMDYEHTPANHVSFRLADLVMVPEVLDPSSLVRYGARRGKLFRYEGIKELIYLSGFELDPAFSATDAGREIDPARILVLARPPADFAVYHRFDNPLFTDVVRRLASDPRVQLFLLPRTAGQTSQLEALDLPGAWFAPESTDGANLVARADLVVSAGGTMNREAAVLGTPAWSLFAGELGAVDRWLSEIGRLSVVRSLADAERLPLAKKPVARALSMPGLLDEIVAAIESLGGAV